MIGFLRGCLHEITNDGILLETGGIGWFVRTPAGRQWPEKGAQVTVYTHLVVREEAMELYGFTDREGLHFFTLLLGVAGIGPRGALQIMATANTPKLVQAIAAEDTAFLTSLPGIGAKKARRLMLELRDKVLKSNLLEACGIAGRDNLETDFQDEVLAALNALGYRREEVIPALTRAKTELGPEAGTPELLQAVLKGLGRGEGA